MAFLDEIHCHALPSPNSATHTPLARGASQLASRTHIDIGNSWTGQAELTNTVYERLSATPLSRPASRPVALRPRLSTGMPLLLGSVDILRASYSNCLCAPTDNVD